MCIYSYNIILSLMCLGKKVMGLPSFTNIWTLQGALKITVTYWGAVIPQGLVNTFLAICQCITGELCHANGILFLSTVSFFA